MTAGREIRETGHAWLPEIPADWQFVPSKALFANRAQHSRTNDVHLTPSQKYGVVTQDQYMQLAGSKVVLNLTGSDSMKHVEPGDFIIHLRSFQGGLERSPLAGKVSLAYTVLKPRQGVLGRYFEYLLKSDRYIQAIRVVVNQLRDGQSIRYQDFGKVPLPLPPPKEQQLIADFLDRETAKIDALIEKQNQLIDLLWERRSAAIRRALTHGLDSGSSTRASDIPSIGTLPAHWRTVPTRYLCRITTGTEDSGNADPDGEYPFFVRGHEILRIGSYGFQGEAVLTPGDGQGGTGKVFHYVQGKFQAHQRVYVFIDFKGVKPKYFYSWLSTFLKPIALAGSNTVTVESLRRPLLANFQVAVPPLDEQEGILAYLERETAKVDALIAKAEEFIVLAKERRAALITAAVTGQIDVLGEAS